MDPNVYTQFFDIGIFDIEFSHFPPKFFERTTQRFKPSPYITFQYDGSSVGGWPSTPGGAGGGGGGGSGGTNSAGNTDNNGSGGAGSGTPVSGGTPGATSMEMPPSSMGYPGAAAAAAAAAAGADPRALELSAAHAQMNAAAAAMHNPYAAVAAAAAANNHTAAAAAAAAAAPGNHVMGGGQVPDVHKRDKDAIYGSVKKSQCITLG